MKTLPEILSTPNAVELKEYELSEALLEQGVTPAVYPVLSPEAQEAIAKELMAIIGEDDKQRWDDDDGFCQTCDFTRSDDSKECICILRNQLRAEQRARLTAFIGRDSNEDS